MIPLPPTKRTLRLAINALREQADVMRT
jgi:hypothetical protein